MFVDTTSGKTFLHEAFIHEHVIGIKYLLKSEVAINRPDKTGKTCIHYYHQLDRSIKNQLSNDIPFGFHIPYNISFSQNGLYLSETEEFPSISTNEKGIVVGVHTVAGNNIWNVIAIIEDKVIHYKSLNFLGKAKRACISINNQNNVVLVQEADDIIRIKFGVLKDESTIVWNDFLKNEIKGTCPVVSLNNNGNFVVGFQTKDRFGSLGGHYSDGDIVFGSLNMFSYGKEGSILIDDQNYVWSSHQSENLVYLYLNFGLFDSSNCNISWGESLKYTKGVHSSISLFKGSILETHKNEILSLIYYKIIKIDRAKLCILDKSNLSVKICHGRTPSVATNEDFVVLSYQKKRKIIQYELGLEENGHITWSGAKW